MRTLLAFNARRRQTGMLKANYCRFSVAKGSICVWLLIILPLVSSCGSTAETVTGPSQVRCGVQAQAEKLSFASDGGTGTMRVTTNRECTWSAQSEAPWLTLTPPMSGQGEGTVQFTVTPNGLPASRATAIKVEDQRLQISQEGRPCEFRVSSTIETVEAAGGDRTVQVTTTSAQCRWTASSDAPWITITSGREGDDTGAVTFRVDPLTGQARTGSLTIAGHVVQVQQGAGCSYTVGTDALNLGAAGGPGEVTVSAAPGCSWTARSGVPWITVTGGAAGNGPGIVALQVAATDGPARTGTVTVAGRIVTVTQSPGCSVTVDSLTYAAPAAASTSVTTVRAAPGCGWTAAATSDWVVVTSGQTGNGTGEVRFSVAENTRSVPRRGHPHRRFDVDRQPGVGLFSHRQSHQRERRRRSDRQCDSGDGCPGMFLVGDERCVMDRAWRHVERQRQWPGAVFRRRQFRPGTTGNALGWRADDHRRTGQRVHLHRHAAGAGCCPDRRYGDGVDCDWRRLPVDRVEQRRLDHCRRDLRYRSRAGAVDGGSEQRTSSNRNSYGRFCGAHRQPGIAMRMGASPTRTQLRTKRRQWKCSRDRHRRLHLDGNEQCRLDYPHIGSVGCRQRARPVCGAG